MPEKKLTSFKPGFLAAALVTVFFLQGLFLIRATSPTTDEIPFHMVNGYAYLVTHDYRMNPSSPALIREWMALPWFLMKPALDLKKPAWERADSQAFGIDFFYKDNRPIADRLLFSARLMILILGTLLGWVIYAWSKSVYGSAGGLLSLFLYVFCPIFLAHSSVATTDIGVALFSTLSAFFLWRYLENSKKSTFYLFAVILALTFAAKSSSLIVGPIFLAIIFFKKGAKFFFSGHRTRCDHFIFYYLGNLFF